MYKRREKAKQDVVDYFKLTLVPLLIAFVAIISVSSITFYVSKNFLLKQMKQDGLNLTRQVLRQIANNHKSLAAIDEIVEDKIRIVGKTLLRKQEHINSELLIELAKELNVDELHWMNKDGEIIYSTMKEYVGWIPFQGHPLYDFVLSNKEELIEDIRPDAKMGNFVKYGAIKNTDGTFIQVGIRANTIHELTERFCYQRLVEELVKEESIVYALFVDQNLKAIADGEKEDIGIVYEDDKALNEAIKGNMYMKEWYDKEIEAKVFDIAVPVFIEGEMIGAFNIGISMKDVYALIYKNAMISLIISIFMFFIFLWVQNKNIIKPVKQLNTNINKIDVENNLKFRLPVVEEDTFGGLAYSINKILDKTYTYFEQLENNKEELKASNEELTSAFQQLTASEEELRAQYDEIQSYTAKLEDLQQKYEIAIKGTNSAVWEVNLEEKTIYFSHEFKNIVDMPLQNKEDIQQVLDKLLMDKDKKKLIDAYIEYKKGATKEIYNQVPVKDKEDNIKWLLISGKGIVDANANLKTINGIVFDITKLKEQEAYIEHLAYHDPLTELPNRRKFMNKLKEEIDREKKGAVMLLDLDNFKSINDTLGHVYGDRILKKVSELLLDVADEKIFLSRFGGDEFLLLIRDEENLDSIENYAKKIANLFKDKFVMNNNEIYITFSMGITRYPYDTEDVDQLIMNADTAMYQAKHSGKNNYIFFNSEMIERLKQKMEIEKILRDALKKEGFKLVYQPQVHVQTGKIVGFEALLRLQNHHISPALFIPVAEETGLIVEIGKWVTKEAVAQIARWQEKGFKLKPIAINLSPKQLNDGEYLIILQEILREKQIDPQYLEIEITESILLEGTEKMITMLNQLKKLGVKIALDDFGTGYSSFSYLTFIPVNKIKLDKSLNDKFLEKETIKVMYSLISLAHSLNLEVTAEGIEHLEQYKRLKVGGCDYIQGYLFSKPLIVEEIEKIYDYNFIENMH